MAHSILNAKIGYRIGANKGTTISRAVIIGALKEKRSCVRIPQPQKYSRWRGKIGIDGCALAKNLHRKESF
jgi:hypothetical protein